jgi:hypothetical protein
VVRQGPVSCVVQYRVRVTLRLAFFRQSVRLNDKPLETHDQHFIQLNPCRHSPYVTSSLTREWVCCLRLLLALVSSVILGFESRGLLTIFYCLRFETPPTWRARPPYLYPQGTGWPSLYPQALGSRFVASYDSQGYGGGIRTRLDTGCAVQSQTNFTTGCLPPISSPWRQAP